MDILFALQDYTLRLCHSQSSRMNILFALHDYTFHELGNYPQTSYNITLTSIEPVRVWDYRDNVMVTSAKVYHQ